MCVNYSVTSFQIWNCLIFEVGSQIFDLTVFQCVNIFILEVNSKLVYNIILYVYCNLNKKNVYDLKYELCYVHSWAKGKII